MVARETTLHGQADRLRNGALWAWLALVGVQTLLNVGAVLFIDVPADRIYRYSNAVQALLQFGVMLAIVVLIARPGGLRETLALKQPLSWKRAAALGVLVVISILLLLAILGPLLEAGEAQRLSQPWDPDRVIPFALNVMVIALVAPVVEELTYRGLGFTLLERFGQSWAIVLTAALFAVSHGLIALLPISVAFGLGLGYLRRRTGSVYPGIALHVLLNALTVSATALAS